jgi:hypothetical protein
MIRRIALTLGAGVAVTIATASSTSSSQAGRELSLSTEAGKHATMDVASKDETGRSGYIVASS